MLAMAQNMELAEAEEDGAFDFDTYPPDAQDQARARVALLSSICTYAAGLWVRPQIDGGNTSTLACGEETLHTPTAVGHSRTTREN